MLMRINRFFRTIASLFIVCLLLAGCSKDNQSDDISDSVADDAVSIGFSFDSFVLERWIKDRDIFVSTAAELGAQVNVQNANGELESQIEQIRYFIKKKVDIIVIVAVDSAGLSDVVREAKENDIKVIAYDRLIYNADIDLYISFDNDKVGRLMAQKLAEKTGNQGNYIMLCGPTTDDNVERVNNGFKEAIADTDIKIIDSMNAVNWRAEQAYEYLWKNKEILEEVDGIMCGNDSIATQAVKFLSERQLTGEIFVVGQDADLDACQRIVEGTQLMTVYKPVWQLAANTARYAVALARNDVYETSKIVQNVNGVTQTTINNGNYACKYISIEPYAVEASNMDSVIIEGGFHLKEDVYLNVNDKMSTH